MQPFLFSLILIAVKCVVSVVGQTKQRAVLYEGKSSSGEYVIIPQTEVTDLENFNFDKRARSVCVVGAWVFYAEKAFKTNSNSKVEYFFGATNYCTDLKTIEGNVRSVRFIGAPINFKMDTITLFEDTYFQGEEEYTFKDLPNLNLAGNHKSLVITGTSGWTVYELPNYKGNSICFFPPQSTDFSPYFLTDLSIVKVPYGTIKSVRKKCLR